MISVSRIRAVLKGMFFASLLIAFSITVAVLADGNRPECRGAIFFALGPLIPGFMAGAYERLVPALRREQIEKARAKGQTAKVERLEASMARTSSPYLHALDVTVWSLLWFAGSLWAIKGRWERYAGGGACDYMRSSVPAQAGISLALGVCFLLIHIVLNRRASGTSGAKKPER